VAAYSSLRAENDKLHSELATVVSDLQEAAAATAASREEAAAEARAEIEAA